MRKINVGLQLYSVKNAMSEDFYGTLKAVRDMGYEYVEFAGYHGKTAEEIKAVLDELGLKCVSVHQSIDFYNDDPIAAVKFLKTFGVKYNVIPWYPIEKLYGSKEWPETTKRFNEIAEILAENGMKLGYHNHDWEFTVADGKYIEEHILESVPEEKIEPELDTCWVKYAGVSPVEMINKYKGKVTLVHLKDFTCKKLAAGPAYALIGADGSEIRTSRADNGFEFRPLGDGMQDFGPILEACDACGTELVVVEQDAPSMGLTELESVKRSREYLKNTFGI